jgi:hypothetical protein
MTCLKQNTTLNMVREHGKNAVSVIVVLNLLPLGLRKVKSYYFVYQAYAKGRWLGRSILEVFTQEFRDRNEQYYVRNEPDNHNKRY